MTVLSETNSIQYVGTGAQYTFTIPFYFLNNAHLEVRLLDTVSGAVGDPLVLNTDYTIVGAGNPAGGTLTMIVAPSATEELIILRDVPETQEADYQENSKFPAETHEMALDKLTMIVQQFSETLDRALRLSPGYSLDTITPVANMALGFDAAGALALLATSDIFTSTYTAVSSYTNLNAAVAAIGIAATELVIDAPTTVSSNLVIPNNIRLRVMQSGSIDQSTYTLSIYSPSHLIAGETQVVFTGTGAVSFANGGYIQSRWWDGLDQAALQAAVNSAATQSYLNVCGLYTTDDEVLVTNKVDLTIGGIGSVSFDTAPNDAMIFRLVGTCTNVTFRDLTLVGDGDDSIYQSGIGNLSGTPCTLTNIHFINLKICDVNVGISFNADLGGTYTGGLAMYNKLWDILGTGAGAGYGIHLARAVDVRILYNELDRCQRHSIYHGKMDTNGTNRNIIAGNIIKNHRQGVATDNFVQALVIARSANVRCYGNIISDFYDGGIGIQEDDAGSFNNSCVDVYDNLLLNRKNVVPGISAGDPSVSPATYFTSNCRLYNNFMLTDRASVGGYELRILNGRHIDVFDNIVVLTGVAGAAYGMCIGSTLVGVATDLVNINVERNSIYAFGSVLTSCYGIAFTAEVCATYECTVIAKQNKFYGCGGGDYAYDSAVTNKYLVVEGNCGQRKASYANGDTTPSVYRKTWMVITNTVATTITDLDDSEDGQVMRLYFADGNTTIGHYGTGNFWLAGGADKTMSAGDTLVVMRHDSYWRECAH